MALKLSKVTIITIITMAVPRPWPSSSAAKLHHNVSFQDFDRCFRLPLTMFLTPSAPRRAREHCQPFWASGAWGPKYAPHPKKSPPGLLFSSHSSHPTSTNAQNGALDLTAFSAWSCGSSMEREREAPQSRRSSTKSSCSNIGTRPYPFSRSPSRPLLFLLSLSFHPFLISLPFTSPPLSRSPSRPLPSSPQAFAEIVSLICHPVHPSLGFHF
jgi:hypothetical protein